MLDLLNQRYGKLTVIEFIRKEGRYVYWKCKCDCGNYKIVKGEDLRRKHTLSCGCLKHKSPPNTTHNMSKTRLYIIWQDMKKRCSNPNLYEYKNYGGRGITVCHEWKSSFIDFRDWALENGYRDDLTIDRIDVNGNYEPDNCRWITKKEQNYNRRNNRIFEYNGKRQTVTQWAEEYSISLSKIYYRLKLGWSFEKIITTLAREKL